MHTAQQISELTRQALADGLLREEDTAVMIHDFGSLRKRIRHLQSCFPPDTLHGLAIKANPLLKVLEFARTLGTGVEAATTGEIAIALKAGYPPEMIVFDSPVKTLADLNWALDLGIRVNCDNLDELKRVDFLLKNKRSDSQVGIRINPQVGTGSILESSVAGEYSKFGVPIKSRRKELTEAFLRYPWLTGVHLHVGSQGCSMPMLVEGAGILYDFAMEMNEFRRRSGLPPVDSFDIGGGLPVRYLPGFDPPAMEDYVTALRQRAPGLHGFRVITEFGRWVFVNSGFTLSRVEYVKHDPGIRTAG